MKQIFIVLSLFITTATLGQSRISVTIDDVPNTRKYEKDNFRSELMDKLDSLKIPVAIFINEGAIYKTEHLGENFELLNKWAKRDYVTLGNHTFHHARYSAIGLDSFKTEINRGESITRELARIHHKSLNYFRFPFNDMGEDSIQQTQIATFLKQKHYYNAPFTVESADWMFNYLYEYYLGKGNVAEAKNIAGKYIENTLRLFDFFDSLAMQEYGRNINHIYLCHDNSLNADYIGTLVRKLKEKNYSFISFGDALKDDVYKQPNDYYQKWGISWIYRWISDDKERMRLMRAEPEMKDVYDTYNALTAGGKK